MAWLLGNAATSPYSGDGDGDEARETTGPVVEYDTTDGEAPEFNDRSLDETPLPGLARHDVAGGVYTPKSFFGRMFTDRAERDYVGPINRQVSTSGTAAQREQSRAGAGTMPIMNTIEPIIRDGVRLGNETFQADKKMLNEHQRGDVTAAPMNTQNGETQSAANQRARRGWIDGYANAWEG